ncbi:MAG TPA: hypothetical protein VH349_14035 [Ktedonobacterales bacterium]|jgi:WD40 repeat protein
MVYDDPNASGDHFARSALEDTSPRLSPLASGRGVSLTRARLLGIVAVITALTILGIALFHDYLPTAPPSSGQTNISVTLGSEEPTWTLAPTATIALNTLAPPLPAFSDWRVAYLDEDTRLHIVSTDGKTQLTGPSMPIRGALGAIQGLAAVSPDGRNLAYPTANGAVIAQLTPANVAFNIVKGDYDTLSWSPNSDILVLGSPGGAISLWRAGQTKATVAYQRSEDNANPIGWIDETRLAIQRGLDRLEIASLDIVSGATRSLITFPQAQLGVPQLLVTPDGRHILLSACSFRGDPFIHRLGLIDTATGAYRTLTNTRAKTDSCLDHIAFQQDTGRLVALTMPENQTYLTIWIVDPQRDAATLITPQNVGYPVTWAPGRGPIITSTAYQLQEDGGPYTIRAIPAAFAFEPLVTTLTTSALTLPLLGLMRNV